MEKIIKCPYCSNKSNQGVFVGNVCSPCYDNFMDNQKNELKQFMEGKSKYSKYKCVDCNEKATHMVVTQFSGKFPVCKNHKKNYKHEYIDDIAE